MRCSGRDYVYLVLLGAFGVAVGRWEVDPVVLLPVAASAYRVGSVWEEEVVRAAAAAAAVSAVVLATPVPTMVVPAALVAVSAGEVSSRLTQGMHQSPAARAGAYVAGGSLAGAASAYASGAEAAAAALVVVSCVYAAGTVRSMELGVEWSVLAAGAAGVLAASAPVEPGVLDVAVAATVTLAFGATAYRADVMTLAGAAGGVLLTFTLVVAGGFDWFLVLGSFVVLGTLSTRYGSDRKRSMGYGHDGPRGIANVASNGTVALIAAVAFAYLSGWGWGSAYLAEAAFVASVATASADTASSEIGVVHGDPKLITDMTPVEPGEDGGVSMFGEGIALAASAAVAAIALALGLLGTSLAASAALAGFLGCNVDSVLGATLEDRVLNNETVNLAACTSGALAAVGLASLL